LVPSNGASIITFFKYLNFPVGFRFIYSVLKILKYVKSCTLNYTKKFTNMFIAWKIQINVFIIYYKIIIMDNVIGQCIKDSLQKKNLWNI